MMLKLVVGCLARSRALVSDGVHSATDMATDIAVLWSVRVSSAPPDTDHPYGHRRFQSLTALFIASLIALAAAFILYDSIVGLAEKAAPVTSWAPVIVAFASIIVKESLYRITVSVARRFRDKALLANAWHHRSDAFSSVPVALGVGFVLLAGPRWHFIDHLVAVALGFIILRAAWKIGRDAVHELTDRAPSPDILEKVHDVLKSHPEVLDFHALRARTVGGFVEMDFHIRVRPELSVRQGHDIAGKVKRSIMAADNSVINVVVHVEPGEE